MDAIDFSSGASLLLAKRALIGIALLFVDDRAVVSACAIKLLPPIFIALLAGAHLVNLVIFAPNNPYFNPPPPYYNGAADRLDMSGLGGSICLRLNCTETSYSSPVA